LGFGMAVRRMGLRVHRKAVRVHRRAVRVHRTAERVHRTAVRVHRRVGLVGVDRRIVVGVGRKVERVVCRSLRGFEGSLTCFFICFDLID